MPNIFPLISAFLCFSLLIPAVSADEVYDIYPETTAAYEILEEPELTESPETLPPETEEAPTEPPVTVPETWAYTETQPETEPTETIPLVTEVTIDPEDEDMLSLILTSQQNTEYATQLIAGFGLFFVVCVICYFSYKFFRIFF